MKIRRPDSAAAPARNLREQEADFTAEGAPPPGHVGQDLPAPVGSATEALSPKGLSSDGLSSTPSGADPVSTDDSPDRASADLASDPDAPAVAPRSLHRWPGSQ